MFDVPTGDGLLTGADLDGAKADFDPQSGAPIVTMDFDCARRPRLRGHHERPRDRGKQLYDQAVASGEAPEGSQQAFLQRFAVVLDNKLTTFPTIDSGTTRTASRAATRRSRASTARSEAKDIALVLQSGSLPVEFTPLSTSLVSATLGKESLDQGLFAGIAAS